MLATTKGKDPVGLDLVHPNNKGKTHLFWYIVLIRNILQ